MAATERFVVVMSRAEKAALRARAVAAGLSIGAYIRRCVAAADDMGTPEEEAELAALLPVFWTTHAQTLRRVDATIRKADETLAFLRAARNA